MTSHLNQEAAAGAAAALPVRGNKRFDRRFPKIGVPRLQVSSGTKDPQEFERRNAALTEMVKSHPDVVRALASGELEFEEVWKAREESNLKYLLAEKRAARERQAESAVPSTPTGAPSSGTAPAASDPAAVVRWMRTDVATLDPGEFRGQLNALMPVLEDRLALPWLETSLTVVVPSMIAIKEPSRRRYETSLRALARRVGVLVLPPADFELVAGISPERWPHIERLLFAGLETARARELAAMGRERRRVELRRLGVRMKDETFDALRQLTAAEWDALERVGRFPPREEDIHLRDRLTESEQQVLRRGMECLQGEAPFAAFANVTSAQWLYLSRGWGNSSSDWNHARRAVSAVFSDLLDDNAYHPVRSRVAKGMPILAEEHRVPDLSPELFRKIVDALRPQARCFPVLLVLLGLRISEYTSLGDAHLLRHTHKVKVPGTKTTSSLSHVQVDPSFWGYIEYAVPSPYQYGWLRREWISACEQVGVTPRPVLHDLRHLHGQWAEQYGAPLSAVQRSLRHKPSSVTARYTDRLDLTQVAQALAQVLESAGFGAEHLEAVRARLHPFYQQAPDPASR